MTTITELKSFKTHVNKVLTMIDFILFHLKFESLESERVFSKYLFERQQ
jgi:hypothetical protein